MRDRVLITGGGGGIGRAIAERCRSDGHEVVTIDKFEGDIIADLSDPEDTKSAIEEALAGGAITRLVNNVGSIEVAPLEEVTLGQLDRAVRLNVQSALLCSQLLVPAMKKARFGRIVNIASRATLGKEGRTTYSATKAALLGMTRTWALELAEHGITVNAIGPGPIRTPLFESANPANSEATQKILRSIPLQRLGEGDDIAHSVSHFLDQRASFVTGQTLYVCGGLTVGLTTL